MSLVHIRIAQLGKRKLTTVQGLSPELDLNKILNFFRKQFACNGSLVEDEEFGTILQLQGDCAVKLRDLLVAEDMVDKELLRLHVY